MQMHIYLFSYRFTNSLGTLGRLIKWQVPFQKYENASFGLWDRTSRPVPGELRRRKKYFLVQFISLVGSAAEFVLLCSIYERIYSFKPGAC